MSDKEFCDGEVNYGLVMPFVVCKSQDGPWEDEPFVAGWELGALDSELAYAKPPLKEVTVLTDNLPQVDLIAMRRGYSMVSKPSEDFADVWSFVALTAFDLERADTT